MSRTLFTVGEDVYELTPELKSTLREKTYRPETRDIWFEGPVLCHEFDDDGVTVERVDVVEVYETYPDSAKDELDTLGATPVLSPPQFTIASPGTLVNLSECA